MTETEIFRAGADQSERSSWDAMKHGFNGRCPKCGEGQIFKNFVTVKSECNHCHQELHHHRADDLPAYLVIVIVGKVVVTGFIITAMTLNWTTWQFMLLWAPITIILALGLLRPIKGAIVGLQWALKMHGFGGYPDYDDRKADMPIDDTIAPYRG